MFPSRCARRERRVEGFAPRPISSLRADSRAENKSFEGSIGLSTPGAEAPSDDRSTAPQLADGDRVYAMVVKGPGRKKEDGQLEIHKKYIDIQLSLAGTDTIGWKSMPLCEHPAEEYNPESDVQFFTDDPDIWLPIHRRFFAVFFPEDAHMPMISAEPLHKIVIKIAVE